jgi:type III pantothenate kinase
MPINDSILFADIGNSRIKLFIDGIKSAFHYKNADFTPLLSTYLTNERFNKVVYSSVNSNVENIFVNLVKNKKIFEFINVKDLISKQNIIDISKVDGMGFDRILGIIGATAYAEPPLITVDCGTAVTVNALDYKSTLIGGAIFAGAYTQKNTLGALSERLVHYKLNFAADSAGTETGSALSFGIVIGTCGAVNRIIDNIIKMNHVENPSIFFTGGYGSKILQHLTDVYPHATYDEYLIFRGMAKLYENTCK